MKLEIFTRPKVLFLTKVESDIFPGRVHYDLMIQGIILRNLNDKIVTITSIKAEVTDSNGNAINRIINGKKLNESVEQFYKNRNSEIFKILDPVFQVSKDIGSEYKPAESVEMPKNTAFRCSNVYLYSDFQPEMLKIEISYLTNEQGKIDIHEQKLTMYEQKNDYIFPLKGSYYIGSSLTQFTHHRWSEGNEHSIDILKIDSKSGLHYNGAVNVLTNHPCFGNDVYASAKGKVIEISDGESDDFEDISKNKEESDHELALRSLKIRSEKNLLRFKEGKLKHPGNYVLIEHSNGECTMYYHLKKNSICVNLDEEIEVGTKIGEIGNSGNSLSPHLHFSLFPSKDSQTETVPIKFSNLYNRYNHKIQYQPLTGDLVTTKD